MSSGGFVRIWVCFSSCIHFFWSIRCLSCWHAKRLNATSFCHLAECHRLILCKFLASFWRCYHSVTFAARRIGICSSTKFGAYCRFVCQYVSQSCQGIFLHLFPYAFTSVFDCKTDDIDNNWVSWWHLVYVIHLTTCSLFDMDTSEANPSSQPFWFGGFAELLSISQLLLIFCWFPAAVATAMLSIWGLLKKSFWVQKRIPLQFFWKYTLCIVCVSMNTCSHVNLRIFT